MLASIFIPKSEQPGRSKPRPFLDSFAAQAKEVIDNVYLLHGPLGFKPPF